MRRTALLLPATLLSLCAPAAHGARPMAADDAAILDPGQCQLETWAQHSRAQNEAWMLPSCAVGDGWDLAAGGARVRPAGGGATTTVALLQGKTVLRAPRGDGWGLGLVLARQFRAGAAGDGEWTANLPLSVELAGERLTAHANAGWARQSDQRRGQGTWALGMEWMAGARHAFTLDGYGRQRGGRYLQLGARHALSPGHADLDLSYGDRASLRGRERYVAIGLTLFAGPPR